MNYSQLFRIVFALLLGSLQSTSSSSNNNTDMLLENIETFQTQCSSSPSVTNCKNFIKERNKLSIKQNILTKLDLQEDFKNAKFPKVPQKIIDEYMKELRLEQDYQSDQATPSLSTVHGRLSGYSAHTDYLNEPEDNSIPPKSIIIFNQIYPKIRHKCSRRLDVLYFPISNSTLNFNVQSARLHFSVNVKQYHQNKSNFVLQIFKGCNRKTEEVPYIPVNRLSSTTTYQWVEPAMGHGHNPHIMSVSLSLHNLKTNSWWVEVDITKVVAKWFKNNSNNNNNSGITFTVFEENDRLEINTGVDYRPYVTVNIIDKRKTRKKRSLDNKCTEQSREQNCCRYPLLIDFDEFGWEFVIAPRQYMAYYCAGDCPHVYKQYRAHTFIAQMSPAAIGPCCSPREYGNISMLYFDADYNIRFSNLPGMVVSKCGCS